MVRARAPTVSGSFSPLGLTGTRARVLWVQQPASSCSCPGWVPACGLNARARLGSPAHFGLAAVWRATPVLIRPIRCRAHRSGPPRSYGAGFKPPAWADCFTDKMVSTKYLLPGSAPHSGLPTFFESVHVAITDGEFLEYPFLNRISCGSPQYAAYPHTFLNLVP